MADYRAMNRNSKVVDARKKLAATFSTPAPKFTPAGRPGVVSTPNPVAGAGTKFLDQMAKRYTVNTVKGIKDLAVGTVKNNTQGFQNNSLIDQPAWLGLLPGVGQLATAGNYGLGNLINNEAASDAIAPLDFAGSGSLVKAGAKIVNNPVVRAGAKGAWQGSLLPKNQLTRNLNMGIDPTEIVDIFGNIVRGAKEATAKERLIQSITQGVPDELSAIVEQSITGKNRLPSIQPSLGNRVWTPSGRGLDNALSIIEGEGQPKNASEAMNMILAHTYGANSGVPIDKNVGQRFQNFYETLKSGVSLPNFEYGVVDPKASTDRVKDTMFSFSRLFDAPKVAIENADLSEMFKAGDMAGDFNLGRYVSDATDTFYKTGSNAGSKKPGVFLSEISDPAYDVAKEVMGGIDPALRISGGWTLPIDHNPMGIGLLRDSAHSLANRIGAEEAYKQTKLVAERMAHSGIAIPETLNYPLGTTLRHSADSAAWKDVPKNLAKVWQEHGLLDSYGSNWKWIKENAPDLAKEMEDLVKDPSFVNKIDEKSFGAVKDVFKPSSALVDTRRQLGEYLSGM